MTMQVFIMRTGTRPLEQACSPQSVLEGQLAAAGIRGESTASTACIRLDDAHELHARPASGSGAENGNVQARELDGPADLHDAGQHRTAGKCPSK